MLIARLSTLQDLIRMPFVKAEISEVSFGGVCAHSSCGGAP